MKLENRRFLQTEKGRKWLIEQTLEVVPKEKNWQSFHTPYDLCEYMVSKTTLEGKSILVIFNVEFLKVLIHKFGVSNTNITFLADCRIESELATKVYKVNNTIVNNIDDIEKELKLKTFDLCFSNPPYGTQGQHFHLKILNEILPICNEILYVHPVNWLLSKKSNQINLFINTKKNLLNISKEFIIFDPNFVFKTNQPGNCCISHIDKNYNGQPEVNYFGDVYVAKSVNDISIFCKDWLTIVDPFKNKIEDYIRKNGNIYFEWNNRIKNGHVINPTKFYCQFSSYALPNYRIIEPNRNYSINHKQIKNRWMNFWFDTEIEMNNFLMYLNTNFVRFCYAIYKSGIDLYDGCFGIIPVMDFTQEWTDEKLYRFFDISNETKEYIINFLDVNEGVVNDL